MARAIHLGDCAAVFDELSYPTDRSTAAETFADVTLVLGDGERNLGELVAATAVDRFESPADLESELHNVLPREAIGEPYQSEGDG